MKSGKGSMQARLEKVVEGYSETERSSKVTYLNQILCRFVSNRKRNVKTSLLVVYKAQNRNQGMKWEGQSQITVKVTLALRFYEVETWAPLEPQNHYRCNNKGGISE